MLLATCIVLKPINAEVFTQPIIWQDLADTDLIRINDTYYYSASNMHFSPGALLLRSWDLVNWEYFTHSVPYYDVGNPAFDLEGGNAYNQGVYASSIRYHPGRNLFYWIGCIQGTDKTYIYSAINIKGPWEQVSVITDYCYYDDGLLVDDDGTMYVAYGRWIPDGENAIIGWRS